MMDLRKRFLFNKMMINERQAEYVSLSFTPIHECDFACRYCFAQGGKTYCDQKKRFLDADIDKILDFFFTKIYPDAKRYRIDFVSGGEPLLFVSPQT